MGMNFVIFGFNVEWWDFGKVSDFEVGYVKFKSLLVGLSIGIVWKVNDVNVVYLFWVFLLEWCVLCDGFKFWFVLVWEV